MSKPFFTREVLTNENVSAACCLAAICTFVAGCGQSIACYTSSTPASVKTIDLDDVATTVRNEPIRPLKYPDGLPHKKVLLGKLLFHDPRLSKDNTIACATCHKISEGGVDGLVVSIGVAGQKGQLNAPTVLNSSMSIAQFWDGRAKNLDEQIQGPIHNPVEMGSTWTEIVTKLNKDPSLKQQFRKVFNSNISKETITEAIVFYEKALVTVDSPFDLYLKGNENAISNEAIEGYKLFKSIGCIFCHQGETVGGNMFQEFGVLGDFSEQFDESLELNKGRFNVTQRVADLRRFKVPSLRNAQKTPPYFHTGSVESLDDAIRIMAEYQLGETLEDEQVKLIKHFLNTLSGSIKKELL